VVSRAQEPEEEGVVLLSEGRARLIKAVESSQSPVIRWTTVTNREKLLLARVSENVTRRFAGLNRLPQVAPRAKPALPEPALRHAADPRQMQESPFDHRYFPRAAALLPRPAYFACCRSS
jgi:hypothetical protein